MSMNVSTNKIQEKKKTLTQEARKREFSRCTLLNIVCSLTDTINGTFNFYGFQIIEEREKKNSSSLPHGFVC